MRINPHVNFTNGQRPMAPGGFRGPSSSMMADFGANQLLQTRLIETVTFLSHAGQRAHRLNDAIASLPSAFSPRAAASSNSDLMQVTSFNGQNLPTTSVMIHQVATTQRNEGTSLHSNTQIEAEGVHKFEVDVDGRTHQISITVEGEVTNRQFQQKMADAINQANLGITASITQSGNNSRLVMETNTTGPGMDGEHRFAVRDVEGEAVAIAGIDEVTQEAQSAVFSVNGGEKQTQATNRVDLGNGLIVTLIAPSDTAVTVHMGHDRASMRNGVRNVVNQFNSLLEAAQVNGADRHTRTLIRDLMSAARHSRRDLERVGITIARDGSLVINENTLNEAMDSGALQRFFMGSEPSPNARPGSSRPANAFVGRLSRISESVIRNPMRHVSPHARNLPGFNAALNAVANHNSEQEQNGNQSASPFDAYSMENLWNVLFDSVQ